MVTTTMLQAKVLIDGSAEGPVRASRDAISFWGGFDPATGEVIDRRHPLFGEILTDTVFVVPHGKGSSTGSPVLVDALLQGNAPAAIILNRVDEIIALGGVVYEEFFQQTMPILVLDDEAFTVVVEATYVRIESPGRVWAYHNQGRE